MAAGAYAARLFADFGAEVIKVERREAIPPQLPAAAPDSSGWFAYLNYGKKSVTAGAADLDALLAGADVLIDSDRRATTARIRHLGAVTIDLSWFGKPAPIATSRRPTRWCRALAGFVQLIGPAEGPPLTLPDYQSAIIGGLAAFIPAMATLIATRAGAGK